MKFIGNKKHIDTLSRTLASDVQPAHASLFAGPADIGKRTLAHAYAHTLIAGEKKLSFDDTQQSAYSGDLLLCTPVAKKDGGTASITIDQLREHLAALTRSPYHGNKRVLIIDDAHLMTTSAQNALLKTLEEPIATSLLILVTDQPSALLPTLHSRCATMIFAVPSVDEMKALSLSEEIAALSFGRPGRARRLLMDEEFYESQKELTEKVQSISTSSVQQRLQLAHEIAADRMQANAFLTMLLYVLHGRARDENDRTLFASLEKIQIAQKLIAQNVNTRLTLENLLVAL